MRTDIQKQIVKDLSDRIKSSGLVQLCAAHFGSFSADNLRRWVADVLATVPCVQATHAFSKVELLLIYEYADDIVLCIHTGCESQPMYCTTVSVTFDLEIVHPEGADLSHVINEADFGFDLGLAVAGIDGAENVKITDSTLSDFQISRRSYLMGEGRV